jgi:hypothetical protein
MAIDIADIVDIATATIADIASIATASATIVVRPRLLELISIAGVLVLGSVHGERRHSAWSLECACQRAVVANAQQRGPTRRNEQLSSRFVRPLAPGTAPDSAQHAHRFDRRAGRMS